jgi:hypothetical protein
VSSDWRGVAHEEGLYLSGPQNSAVEDALAEAAARQPDLDGVMRDIAGDVSPQAGKIVGLQYSLKRNTPATS